jgi:protein-S-isoprenylcysteine O-methyltransferase Ste14
MPDTSVAQAEPITPSGIRQRIATLVQGLGQMALWTALLFIGAGTLHWIRGWICTAVYFVSMTMTGMVIHHFNHDLIQARSKWRRKDTQPFDKIFIAIFIPLTFIQVAMAGLDAVRFGWSHMPLWTLYPGFAIFLVGIAVVTWTMALNPYAETTVRIQYDRGHTVISSGPYRIVRHPMYVGSILMYPGTALMLGSKWALLLSAMMALLLVVRTALEDETLRRELAGYEQYAVMTRYRLIPGVW